MADCENMARVTMKRNSDDPDGCNCDIMVEVFVILVPTNQKNTKQRTGRLRT